jgi:kynurenine formamidase
MVEGMGQSTLFSRSSTPLRRAAEFLLDCGVELTGVDMPSVDQAPYPAHRVLLAAGVPIVENLTNLDAIGADFFELIVLPLRLAGRDGSPVRAIAVTRVSKGGTPSKTHHTCIGAAGGVT